MIALWLKTFTSFYICISAFLIAHMCDLTLLQHLTCPLVNKLRTLNISSFYFSMKITI